MKNKDVDRLIHLCIKGWITKEELIKRLDELEKPDKKDMPEPPKIY